MKDEKVSASKIIKWRRYSLFLLTSSILLVILSLLGLGIYELRSVRGMEHLINIDFKREKLLDSILQQEEITTMSVRMALSDNNKKWEKRFYQYRPLLNESIADLALLAPEKQYSTTAKVIEVIKKVNEMQDQAFTLYKNNNVNKAKEVIFGSAFDKARKAYRDEMAQYNQFLEKKVDTHLQNKIDVTRYVIITIFSIFTILILVWYYVYRYVLRMKRIKDLARRLQELKYYEQLKLPQYFEGKEISQDQISMLGNTGKEEWIREIKEGIEKKQFILYYQPIVNAIDEKIVGMEALLRWHHPYRGLLLPQDFLVDCENTGLIVPLGAWVLRTACVQIKKWQKMGYAQLGISVNLSVRQFKDPSLLTIITEAITESQISPSSLTLEITESLIMQDVDKNIELLRSLRKIGVQLSLDDFGTGYSSLNYLKQFPFTTLKIDKSFVADIATNIVTYAIVEAIIALGKNLGLHLTAEGVEYHNQLHLLKKLNCDYLQGYLFSKPLPVEEITQQLHKLEKLSVRSAHGILLADEDSYQYQVLSSKHYEQAVRVITETFCQYEPMTKYLGITPQEFTPFAQLMTKKAIHDGLSMVAMDGNKVIACTIVEDIVDPLEITIDLDQRFKIIFSLLEQLGSEFFGEKNFGKGNVAHLFITAVDKKYHGKGLSRKINFESIELAKEKGFDFMCCEFTHNFNEKGTVKNIKNSKLLIRSCRYKDYIFNNEKPFLNLEGAASEYIWQLRDDAKLRYHLKPTNVVDEDREKVSSDDETRTSL